MPYLKLKTSKLNYTQLGGTYPFRPNEGASTPPPPNSGWSYPFLYECYLHLLTCYVFPQGLRVVLIQANSSPSLSMPRWELLLPVYMNVTYELCEVTSTPNSPTAGESYPSCMNVSYGLFLSLGASSPTPSPLGELASPV